MKKLVEFPLESGGSIIVEVDARSGEEGMIEAARPGELIQKASKTLEDALSKVTPAAEAIIKKLGDLAHKPDDIEIEFGLKLSAETDVIIASAAVEANYVVKLKWSNLKNKP
jgi:hypothetical protein